MKNMTKLYGKWETENIETDDKGLQRYVTLDADTPIHNQGTQSKQALGQSNINLLERLVNTLMRGGTGGKISGKLIRGRKGTGKKTKMYKIVEEAMDTIQEETGKNPIEILLKAIENSAPREETTRVRYGGVMRHEPVDVSPKRRLDFALRNIGKSVVRKSFNSPKSAAEALKEELIKASNNESDSYAVSQKINVERIAQSSR